MPVYPDALRAAEAAGVFTGRKPLYTNGQLDPAAEERDLPDVGSVKYPTGRDIQTEVDYIQLRTGGTALAEFLTIPGKSILNWSMAVLRAISEPTIRKRRSNRARRSRRSINSSLASAMTRSVI